MVLLMVLCGYYRIGRIDSPRILIDAFVFFVASLVILKMAMDKKQIVSPIWKRID